MCTRNIAACLMILVLCSLPSTAVAAKVMYVDDDAIGANDGSSWSDAYNHLQNALADANSGTKPVEIRVAGGVYRPDEGAGVTLGDRKATFQLINGVTVRGGYAGFDEVTPDARDIEAYETVLSGDLNGNDLGSANNAENSYHLVTGSATDETAILDGFTITGGNANGLGPDSFGGGMYNGPGSSPTLTNCTFSRNVAAGHGAGMYNDSSCSPTLTDCAFRNNSAVGYGGGVYNGNGCSGTLTNCVFTENVANYGGGMRNSTSHPTLTNCTFSENSADYAAGMNNADGSDATLTNCTFSGNSAETNGGGMLNSYSSPLVQACTFSSNSARGDGAGMYNYFENTEPLIRSCIFKGNFAEGDGGAMYNRNDTVVTVQNCLFTGNSSRSGKAVACDSHGGGHRYPNVVRLINCILWEGGNEIWIGDDSVVWVNYSVIPGGWPGLENHDFDPRLTPDGHLHSNSLCMNRGDIAYEPEPGETDIDGEPREYQRIDMGPDEFIDSDWDGLPDWWEQKYFGGATAGDPEGDPDGDGLDNRAEYESSRNPLFGPREYYVDPVAGSDQWDGLAASWDGAHGPKCTIQSAVDATLQYEGDAVILAPGAYTGPGNRDINLRGRVITVQSTDPDDPAVVAATVIDCQGNVDDPHRGFDFHYGEGPDSAVLGLTIANGLGLAGGGGIFCRYASPTISKNIIKENTADGDGGGIYVRGSAPMIVNNTIKANTADDDGGGIACRDSSATISGNVITENASPGDNGGGIFCRGGAPTITNNIITGNRAEDGGGIWLRDCSLAVANNTITGNVAEDTGGGIGCRSGGVVATVPAIVNSIVWGNAAVNGSEIALIAGSTLTVGYSNVRRGPLAFYTEADCALNWATGNIEEDPCFVEPGYWNVNGTPEDANDDFWIDGDYHLKSEGWRWDEDHNPPWWYDDVTSRCVDAGNPGSPLGGEPVTLAVDPLNQFGRNLRINMGAYGGTAQASMPPYDWALRADLTNDGTVDFEDFAEQASSRLEGESERCGDLNRNGSVDMGDVALLTEEWLRQTSWCEP
jgi:hypothetical protein